MSSDVMHPAYPRLAVEEAHALVQRISELEIDELIAASSTDLTGLSYYPMAIARVDEATIREIQSRIREIARRHGFPAEATAAQKTAFDRELGAEILSLMPMTPADAADEGVWSFISLKVCPGVTAWRYPPGAIDDDGRRKVTPERYLGRPRNVFRRLWWRAYTLGAGVSTQLIEDETVQIMERPSIGGYVPLARLVADRQLRAIRHNDGQRQEVMREAAKRLRRRMGFVSVFALGERQLARLVDEVFEEAYSVIHGRPMPEAPPVETEEAFRPQAVVPETPREASDEPQPVAEPPASERTGAREDPVALFIAACGEHAEIVERLLMHPTWDEFVVIRGEMHRYRLNSLAESPVAAKIAADLEILFDQWEELTDDEQTVVAAAARYFIAFDDTTPDYYVDGLTDDDAVVEAAFTALSRARP